MTDFDDSAGRLFKVVVRIENGPQQCFQLKASESGTEWFFWKNIISTHPWLAGKIVEAASEMYELAIMKRNRMAFDMNDASEKGLLFLSNMKEGGDA